MKKKINSYIKGDLINGIKFIRHTTSGSHRKAIFECPHCKKNWETRFDKVRSKDATKCKQCSGRQVGIKNIGSNSGLFDYNKEKYNSKSIFVTTNKYAKNQAYRNIRKSARERSIPFLLTKEQILFIITQPCHYCGTKPNQQKKTIGKKFIHHGIDRMNNNYGYKIDNVVSCCTACNRGKNTLEYDSWINYLNNLTSYRSSLSL